MEKKYYMLCYNNQHNPLCKYSGWQCANVFDHYPTFDDLMSTSLLGTGYLADKKIAELLTDGSGHLATIRYNENDISDFFEVGCRTFEFGQDVNLWDMAITGYSVHSPERCVMWTDEKIS